VAGLSVTIITRDAAATLADALASVAWADEIVVVDAGSRDETVALARQYTDRVATREWRGYGDQKNYAAGLARHDWILSIDADERVTPELAAEIRALFAAGDPPCRGYRVPRVSWYLGRWIRGTDWYPDYQLRLYDRRAGRWNARRVHESVVVDGPVGTLRAELEHRPYRDIADHLETMQRYAALAAEEMLAEGRRAGAVALACLPAAAFVRNYVLRRGFALGVPGLIVSGLNAYYVFLKLARLWELRRDAPGGGSHP
jgi:glycosyltransferase involved in cell wall biosynthesis